MRVVVIGGGIVGASTAYHLVRKGAEVVVVDKFHQGQATAAGAGIVCPWVKRDTPLDWYILARAGALYYPDLMALLEEDGETNTGYGVVGALAVSSDLDELDQIEATVRQRRMETPEVGEVSRLTSVEAQSLFPPLREGLEAVHVTGAARVDGRLLREAMWRAAEKHGATRYEGLAGLVITDGKVTGVSVNEKLFRADAVVVAGGAWVLDLLAPLGLEIPVEPQKGQIVHLHLPGQDTSKWPVVLPLSSHYLVSFADSRVVVGATRETGSGFDYRITPAGIKEVIDEALSVAPGLADSTLHDIRIGFRPMGPDILPLLGAIDGVEGLIVATGLGASGLTIGPYAGAVSAKLALKEKLELDLSLYNPLLQPLDNRH